MIWRRILALPILGLFLLSTSCDGFFVSDNSIQSVAVTPAAVILMSASSSTTSGDSFALTSMATSVGGTQTNDTTTATWTSSDTSKVTVSSSGVVTVATGATTGNVSATVTAKDGGATSNNVSAFLYTGAVPTTLNLTGTTGTVAPGTYQLKVTLDTSGSDVTNFVVWTSSNTSVATVSSTGLVTVLTGSTTGATATITATAHLGAPSGSATPTPLTTTASFTVA